MISENNPKSLSIPLSSLQHFSRMEGNCVYILDKKSSGSSIWALFLASFKIDLRDNAYENLANLTRESSRGVNICFELRTLASKILEPLSLARPHLKVYFLRII